MVGIPFFKRGEAYHPLNQRKHEKKQKNFEIDGKQQFWHRFFSFFENPLVMFCTSVAWASTKPRRPPPEMSRIRFKVRSCRFQRVLMLLIFLWKFLHVFSFKRRFTLIHMVDGWMGRVSMCNETLLDECYLCLLAQVSFILGLFSWDDFPFGPCWLPWVAAEGSEVGPGKPRVWSGGSPEPCEAGIFLSSGGLLGPDCERSQRRSCGWSTAVRFLRTLDTQLVRGLWGWSGTPHSSLQQLWQCRDRLQGMQRCRQNMGSVAGAGGAGDDPSQRLRPLHGRVVPS